MEDYNVPLKETNPGSCQASFKDSRDEVINSHRINKIMRYSVTPKIVSSLKFNMSNYSDL